MSELTVCEAEIRDGIASSLETMPEAVPEPPENSIYNFNAILDEVEV
jgi:hypothetical protein